MAFFFGMFLGLSIGIGLIIAFAKYEKIRSTRRIFLARTVAAFARMTVQDSRKILPRSIEARRHAYMKRGFAKNNAKEPTKDPKKTDLVFMSLIEAILIRELSQNHFPLTWLNVQLEKIWPSVNEAASELIKASVEPILEQYTPAILASLKFDKLTLGTVAPQFTGISILESESGADGITMEMDIQWDGNPNIVLNINTRLGVALPVQVKDIGFTGVFRLIFKPLVHDFPCFGAVAYSLREKRSLDFTLKVIGGDLSSIPGVSDAIEETIRNAIEDSITWPVRNIIPIIPGDYSYMELKPEGTLDVKLVQAKDLTNKDVIGKSDPFAVLFIRPLPDKTKTSKTIDNQLNPIWNEHYEFIVEDASTQHLTVKVFDDEGVQEAELIGLAQVALKDLEPGKVEEMWLKLVKDLVVQRDNKNRGQVQLELLYSPYGTESSLKNPFNADYSLTSLEKALKPPDIDAKDTSPGRASQKNKEVIVRGVLSVIVISGENLPPIDHNGKADPYVVLTMKKSEAKSKTRVANETLNPVWNQTFDFVVEDALHEMLILEVYDHDTFRKEKIGRIVMTLTRVLLDGEVQKEFEIDGAKSGSLSLHLKWSPQLVFRDRDTQ